MVPPVGIEPTPDDYKSSARPSCYGGRKIQRSIIIAYADQPGQTRPCPAWYEPERGERPRRRKLKRKLRRQGSLRSTRPRKCLPAGDRAPCAAGLSGLRRPTPSVGHPLNQSRQPASHLPLAAAASGSHLNWGIRPPKLRRRVGGRRRREIRTLRLRQEDAGAAAVGRFLGGCGFTRHKASGRGKPRRRSRRAAGDTNRKHRRRGRPEPLDSTTR